MLRHERPPGWSFNPSAWPHRSPVLGLALAGLGIAVYLTLFQVGAVAHVWEPFFGNGSTLLLKHSPVARFLPIPDASLGAFTYLCEVAAEACGGEDRWRTAPWLVLLLGFIAGCLGLAGIGLVVMQPVFAGTFCTLCLGSAGCSVLSAVAAAPEVVATVRRLRREAAAGRPWARAVWGDAVRAVRRV